MTTIRRPNRWRSTSSRARPASRSAIHSSSTTAFPIAPTRLAPGESTMSPGATATVGTIDADGLYTAPAAVPNPAQVTVKAVAAADTTKSDTAAVTVTGAAAVHDIPRDGDRAGGRDPAFHDDRGGHLVPGRRGRERAPLGSIPADGAYTAPLAPPLERRGDDRRHLQSRHIGPRHGRRRDPVLQRQLPWPLRLRVPRRRRERRDYIGGRLTADGAGAISDGILDMSQGSGVLMGVPFTGAYQVAADGGQP